MRSVLIVDDHAPFRSAVRSLLERGGFRVVGEAGDGDAAVAAVRRLAPEVVLLDVQLPGEDGFAICARILGATDAGATAPVVVLTSGRPIGTFRRRLARSQAAGFIAKTDLTAPALLALVAGAVDVMTSRRRWVLAGAGAVAGIALGLRAAAAWNPGVDPRLVVWDLAVGWSYIGGGLAAWAARPSSAAGRLLAVVGVAWFAGSIWPSLEFLHRGPLFHLLATYPTGRLTVRGAGAGGWLRAVAVVAVYAASVTRLGGDQLIVAAVAAGFIAFGAAGVLRTHGAMRRARLTSSAVAISVGIALLAPWFARLIGSPLGITALLAYDAVLAIGAIALTVDLLAGRWSQSLLTSAVVDLGDGALAGSVRERLARSLGDPSLVVGYAVDDPPGSFVDEFGQPVSLPPSSPGRAVTPMVVAGRPAGFIAQDPAVLDDPRLVGTISAAAALAMSNSTMQAVVRARVADVEASRERLVHAADDQRRRLEQRLQAGATKRLQRVAGLLGQVEPAGTEFGPRRGTPAGRPRPRPGGAR